MTATDPESAPTALTWSIAGGADAARFTIDASSGALSFVTAPNFEAPADANADNVYQVTVRVSDPGGLTAQNILTITVADVNEAPTVTSSATFSVAENGTAVATMTATDPESPASALTWSIVGGADAALFAIDAATGALSFVAAPDFETPLDVNGNNLYHVNVQAADPGGLSGQKAVAVTVTNVNEAPAVTSATAFTTAENTTAVATLSATDPESPSSALAWSIVGGADAARFAINASTGALSFVTAPNFEAPADANADNVYQVIVQVADPGSATAQQAIAVTVANANEAPTVTSPASYSVAENGTAVATMTATDPDLPAQPLSWSIVAGGDSARFGIDSATGALSFVTTPNFEAPADANADNVYTVTVRVSDGLGGSADRTLSITVTDVNEAPTVTSPAAMWMAENTTSAGVLSATDPDLPAQGLSWSIVGGADAARFAIAGGPALAFVAAPDFEAPADANADNVYEVTVRVTDALGAFVDQSIAVTVTNANEAPVIGTAAALTADENTQPVIALAAVDPDSSVTPIAWSLSGADASRFVLDVATSTLRLAATPDFEAPADADANNVYTVTLRATDPQGAYSEQVLNLTIADVNEAPTLVAPAAWTVAENGTAVTALSATDPDLPAQAITWSIDAGADGARFVLDPTTHALAFAAAPDFEAPADANGDNVYQVTVRATDSGGASTTQTMTITVRDVNEAPTIAAPASVATDEDTPLTLSVAAGTGLLPGDPDAAPGPLTVTLSAQSGTFTLAGTSGLTFTEGTGTGDTRATFTGTLASLRSALASLRFTPDADFNGTAGIDVRIADAGDATLSSARHVDVSVRSVNDAPVLSGSRTMDAASDATKTIDATVLAAQDVDTPASALVYTVTGTGTLGSMTLNGSTLGVGGQFTQADLDAGRVAFRAQPNVAGTDTVALELRDSQGGTPIATQLTVQVKGAVIAFGASGSTTSSAAQSSTTSAATTSATSSTTDTATSTSSSSGGGGSAAAAQAVAGPVPTGSGSGAAGGSAASVAAKAGGTATTAAAAAAATGEGSGSGAGSNDRRGAIEAAGMGQSAAYADLSRRMGLEPVARRDLMLPGSYERMQMQQSASGDGRTVVSVARSQAFQENLNRVRDGIEERVTLERNIVASSAAVSASLSIGYVVWLLRGGVLLSSLLASVPAWGSFDPLPILSAGGRRGRDGEDDSLQGMLKKAAHRERAASAAGVRAPAPTAPIAPDVPPDGSAAPAAT
jgi:hypothetical protein